MAWPSEYRDQDGDTPPRVEITYDVEIEGGLCREELPFVIGVLADLAGHPPADEGRKRLRPVMVDRDNFESVLDRIGPRLALTVDDRLRGDGSTLDVELRFETMDDFEPADVARQVGPLAGLLEARRELVDLKDRGASAAALDAILREVEGVATRGTTAAPASTETIPEPAGPGDDADLLGQILAQGQGRDEAVGRTGRDEVVARLVEGLREVVDARPADLDGRIDAGIAEVDRLLTAQINAILHHPEFQKLEASWRGLRNLVYGAETGERLKIRAIPASKRELARDQERAGDFDRSDLFEMIHDEFMSSGGMPYGALIGDYEFDNSPGDVALLAKIARVAAEAHAPFVSAAAPGMFGFETFADLAEPRDLSRRFEGPEYRAWNAFRESEESRFVALCLPRVLMRLPHGPDSAPVDEFDFREDVDGGDRSKYLWGNAAYAMGGRIADSFARHGWCAPLRGIEHGGRVEGLPIHAIVDEWGEPEILCPVEARIRSRAEDELATLGFVPLLHCLGTDFAAFLSVPTCRGAAGIADPIARADAEHWGRLPSILTASRFVHYLRAMALGKNGRFPSLAEWEGWLVDRLNGWIDDYTMCDWDAASPEMQARRPLSGARVLIESVEGLPRHHRAVAYLTPRYRLGPPPAAAIRLEFPLPSPIP